MSRALTIGTNRNGEKYRLTAKDLSTHLHVCGASGRGKSRFLEAMVRDQILAGNGVCVIDPHGTLFSALVKWIGIRGLDRTRTIHLIDPSVESWTTGINPLRVSENQSVSACADKVIDAISQVWGGEDTNKTPTLKMCLREVLHVLIVQGYTLLEAIELVSAADPDHVRGYLTDDIQDHMHKRLWGIINAKSDQRFDEHFLSTVNRLVEFIDAPQIRRLIGTNMEPIDFRACMDNGNIVLVNLRKGVVSHDNARLIGTLITSELFAHAFERDEQTAKRKPYYLVVDECSRFLTRSIEHILDETRKFGLHCVLSHQRLGQLRRDDEAMYNAIMAGAQSKVIFGCNEEDDAELMTRHLFRDVFDLERPVLSMVKPVAVDQVPEWLESVSETESAVEGSGESDVTSMGLTAMTSQFIPEHGDSRGHSIGQAEASGSASATTHFSARGYARTSGKHQSFKTVYKMMPTENWSLERWIHEGMTYLRELPDRQAVVKVPGRRAVTIRTPYIADPISSDATAARMIDTINEQSVYAMRRADVELELETRRRDLLKDVVRWSGGDSEHHTETMFQG